VTDYGRVGVKPRFPWRAQDRLRKKRKVEWDETLTSIDEAVVVLLERLGSVSLAGECDCCTALGTAIAVKMQVQQLHWSNCRMEKFLNCRKH
jgi:hypothetical protein